MKNRIHAKATIVMAVLLLCGQFAPRLLAQPLLEPQNPLPSAVTQPAPVQLSSDVWDVVRLARGHASDETIIAFIKNAGKAYMLGASEILYLRQQGVSDSVLTAMLNQPRNVPQTAPAPVWASDSSPQNTPAPAPPAPAPATVTPAPSAQAPVYAQPAPLYVYSTPAYVYSDPWPHYGAYWGYPGISFSFGWGGHYGGYHGGYHGGGYHGGGHGGRHH